MKKVLATFFILFSLCAFAQKDRISIGFEYPEDDYVRYLSRFLNIGMIKAEIKGDSLENKEYDIELIVCRDGDFERINLTEQIGFKAHSDSISLYFIAQPISAEKVKVEIVGSFGLRQEIEIDTTNSLLIEPVNNAGFGYKENIPIMAYSPGVLQEIQINGEVFQGFDVCGVRYSELNPAEWHDKLGIKNYFFFELVPKPEK